MDLGLITKYEGYTEKNKVFCITETGVGFYELYKEGVQLADIIDGFQKNRVNGILKEEVKD